jgi:TPR repeat protein
MINLAVLEKGEGNLGQARRLYKQVIATGHTDLAPRAMFNLGNLEREHGNLGQARYWWQQVITTGHTDEAPGAMFNLAVLETEQGNLDQARSWYQQAISTGHAEMTSQAQHELRALDQHKRDRERGEHFGRYGYRAYADPTLMNRDDQSPEISGPPDTQNVSEPATDMSDNDVD